MNEQQLTEWEPIQTDGNISGFSDTEISLYQKVADDNQVLQEKCDKLQKQLAFWTSFLKWCQAFFVVCICLGIGSYLGYLFANIEAYQRGYSDASLRYSTQICGLKHSRATSAFRDCLEGLK